MIRNRIKARREQKQAKKAEKLETKNDVNDNVVDDDVSDEFDKIEKPISESSNSPSNEEPGSMAPTPSRREERKAKRKEKKELKAQKKLQKQMSPSDSRIASEDFNYLTDICKDKVFSPKDLKIILKVLRLELQPLIYFVMFIKGVLMWNNTAFTFVVLSALLYVAKIGLVNYLFGFSFLFVSFLMYSMKLNAQKTIIALSLLISFVVDDDLKHNEMNQENDDDALKEPELKKYQIFKRARRARGKIQRKVVQLGEYEYFLFQLSIYIGKLRAVMFYMNKECGNVVCLLFAAIGLLSMLLPLRVNFAVMVVLMFSIVPIQRSRQRRGKEEPKVRSRIKTAIAAIEPDIPDVRVFVSMNKE